MGWLITLCILVLLALLPLGVSIAYDEQGPRAFILAGPVKQQVYPAKKDPDKPPRPKKQKKKPQAGAGQKSGKSNGGGPISDFYPFVELVLDLLTDFRHKLRVNVLELKITLAGGDPADLAINYGKAWTAIGILWPRLEELFVIKKRNVEVLCDFEGSQTTVEARLDLTITLGRLLSMIFRHGYGGVKEYFNFRKKRQGGKTV